jgi:hypothetical protein
MKMFFKIPSLQPLARLAVFMAPGKTTGALTVGNPAEEAQRQDMEGSWKLISKIGEFTIGGGLV